MDVPGLWCLPPIAFVDNIRDIRTFFNLLEAMWWKFSRQPNRPKQRIGSGCCISHIAFFLYFSWCSCYWLLATDTRCLILCYFLPVKWIDLARQSHESCVASEAYFIKRFLNRKSWRLCRNIARAVFWTYFIAPPLSFVYRIITYKGYINHHPTRFIWRKWRKNILLRGV